MKILLITLLAVGLSTVAGTFLGLIVRKIPHKYNDVILGCASGIMLAAAVLGLIGPAAGSPGRFALPLTVAGVFAGAFLVSLLDKVLPHLHKLAGVDVESHPQSKSASKVLLFVFAIAIHKFPEGLAAGVSFGTENLGDILTVSGSIALQNVPEAMVIVSPLLSVGVSMKRTVLFSVIIGLISVAGTLSGYGLVSVASGILPFILAFAGGTMLYVVSDEMIPETHSHGFEKQATFSMLAGFMLILVMQHLL